MKPFHLIAPDKLCWSRSSTPVQTFLQWASARRGKLAWNTKIKPGKQLGVILMVKPHSEEVSDLTNQVGQPIDLSMCKSRSGAIFNISTKFTMARGTWKKITTLQPFCNYYIDVGAKRRQHTSMWSRSKACRIRLTTFFGEKNIWKTEKCFFIQLVSFDCGSQGKKIIK